MWVGTHLGGFQEVSEVVDMARSLGANAAQVFLSPPIGKPSAAKYRLLEKMGETYRTVLREGGVRLFVHAPYTLNLAKAWLGPGSPYWVDAVVRELELASFCGAEGVVLHVGKRLELDEEEALENMRRSVREVMRRAPPGPRLLLETAAGQGTEVCRDPLDLARFVSSLRQGDLADRLGLCFDTCHVFAASQSALHELLPHVHAICPVYLVHLNDSKKERGSRVDRHETLHKGHIPTEELRGVVEWAHRNSVACVLETPSSNSVLREEIRWMRQF